MLLNTVALSGCRGRQCIAGVTSSSSSSSFSTLRVNELRSVSGAAAPDPFASRARSARQVRCRARVETKERWWEKESEDGGSPNVKNVYNMENFLYQLGEHRDKLVVVDFFATWCGSCRALYPKLLQLARENEENIVILKVNFDEHKKMSKQLGVRVLPYFILYRGSMGKVAEFSASLSKLKRLRSAIAEHSTPFCSIGDLPEILELVPDTGGDDDKKEGQEKESGEKSGDKQVA